MNNILVLDNYFNNYKIIKFIENHSFIIFDKIPKLNILFNFNQYNYFMNIQKCFKGKLNNCNLENMRQQKFKFILEISDTYILEFLGIIYEKKIKKDIKYKSKLYNDYIILYNQLLNKDNAKYYYI